jgi:GAF domain-containing protein
MIEVLEKLVVPGLGDEELDTRAFNLNVILLITFAVMLLGVLAMLFQIGNRPLSYVLPNVAFIAMAALVVVLCYYLSRTGRVQAASIVFVAMMTVACFGAVIVGGMQGALGVILIIPVAAAGITLGSNVGLGMAGLSVAVLVAVGFLERSGVLVISYPDPEMTLLLNMFDVGFALVFATLSIWLAGYGLRQSLARTRQAVADADRYRQDLESSLGSEQAVRDRLKQAVDVYTAHLEQVGRGDYEARLSFAREDEDLFLLERQLNVTVDRLVAALEQAESALDEAEEAQRRYVVQSWRDYVGAGTPSDFELGQPETTVSGSGLSLALKEALTQHSIVASTQLVDQQGDQMASGAALAVPIEIGGQVVGVLGVYRQGDAPAWTEDQRALVRAVVERLAMAIESRRLFDDVQRRAAREQTTREITDRMRGAMDMDELLQTAIRETASALGASRAFVQWVPSEQVANEDL